MTRPDLNGPEKQPPAGETLAADETSALSGCVQPLIRIREVLGAIVILDNTARFKLPQDPTGLKSSNTPSQHGGVSRRRHCRPLVSRRDIENM